MVIMRRDEWREPHATSPNVRRNSPGTRCVGEISAVARARCHVLWLYDSGGTRIARSLAADTAFDYCDAGDRQGRCLSGDELKAGGTAAPAFHWSPFTSLMKARVSGVELRGRGFVSPGGRWRSGESPVAGIQACDRERDTPPQSAAGAGRHLESRHLPPTQEAATRDSPPARVAAATRLLRRAGFDFTPLERALSPSTTFLRDAGSGPLLTRGRTSTAVRGSFGPPN